MSNNVSIILPNLDNFEKIVLGLNSEADRANDAQLALLEEAANYIDNLDATEPIVSADRKKITWSEGTSKDLYSGTLELAGTNLSLEEDQLETFTISRFSFKLTRNSDNTVIGSAAIGFDISVVDSYIRKVGITDIAFKSGQLSIVNRGAITLDFVNERISTAADLSIFFLSGSNDSATSVNRLNFVGDITVDLGRGTLSGTLSSISVQNGALDSSGVFKPSQAADSELSIKGLSLDLERLLELPEDATDEQVGAVIFSGSADSLTAAESATLPGGVEKGVLLGSGNIDLTGNSIANTLVGNSGHNVLDGKAGADTMTGGRGNDSYYVNHENDRVTEKLDEGVDTVYSRISYTLPSHVENLTLLEDGPALNAMGNALDNSISGNSDANLLYGGRGIDFLDGGDDDDVYLISNLSEWVVGDRISDSGNWGEDTVRFASTTRGQTLIVGDDFAGIETVEIGSGKGIAPTNPSGTTPLNVDASGYDSADFPEYTRWLQMTGNYGPNKLTGTNLRDSIYGNHGSDTLIGGVGYDFLVGGRGADTLIGGANSDTFRFLPGDSGQSSGFDVIADFQKAGQRDETGWYIDHDYIQNNEFLSLGGSAAPPTSNRAQIDANTSVAAFADNSGTSLSDALSDIANSLTQGGDKRGQIALFQVNQSGDFYLYISDGRPKVGTSDVVVQLVGIGSVLAIELSENGLSIY